MNEVPHGARLVPDRDLSTIDPRGLDGIGAPPQGRLIVMRAPAQPTLDGDAATLASEVGTQLLVPLLTAAEMLALGLDGWLEIATTSGLTVVPFAIDDMSVPSDLAAFDGFVAHVASSYQGGATVAVHCRAGLGRSGLVAACLLVHLGASAETAISCVRAARPGAIETPEQEAFVARYAGRRGARRTGTTRT